MPTYEISGEDFDQALPLEIISTKDFQGVRVYRMLGSKVQVRQSTDMLSEAYGADKMTTLGDAEYIGKLRIDDDLSAPVDLNAPVVDIYELILLRKL